MTTSTIAIPSPAVSTPLQAASNAVRKATDYSYSTQRADGHWCAELESNCTITSEYVFMCQALGLDLAQKREGLVQYLSEHQNADGSWGIAHAVDGDVSTTAECYLALRILGIATTDARLERAASFISNHGGLEKMRVFTRIFFALFGLFPWDSVPVLPPELILLPASSPVNIYAFASWARGTIVPLLVLFHHKPLYALPNGKHAENDWLDHLWQNPRDKHVPYAAPLGSILRTHKVSAKSIISLGYKAVLGYETLTGGLFSPVRKRAVQACVDWVLEHQEPSGDWAGIFPPMVNGVLALHAHGYAVDSDPMRRGLEAIERFTMTDTAGVRVEACQSPVWDTCLTMIGLLDCEAGGERLLAPRDWMAKLQILDDHGDWKVYNGKGKPGGWSFEYSNTWYPDVDDTAAVVMALLKQDRSSAKSDVVRRAIEWIVSMQNDDGGWAAFDRKNDKLFLNDIPFSDMDSLCDPSTPDIVGRILEALGILGDRRYEAACARGIEYLRKNQEPEGSWYGRWGVNYVYGTSNVLCGLVHHGFRASDPMVARALGWLKAVQNADGGWGEHVHSYADRNLMGRGTSTASQTAWGLMALLAFLPPDDPSVQRGIAWLVSRQTDEGTWNEKEFTGTGFPKYFYLRYHMYRHYFPLMALGRYVRALRAS
ncbi:squalene--hopene cyclase [Pendulispora brunnea]|uniref:Squalene--hopene cyclase n=1 Tax=Pendulispora brunnea TaxID=2905690 RepID=A0ABZ2KMN2_9BACT